MFKGDYIISAPWQTALGMGNPIGQVVGALLIGFPMEWYGRKWVSLLLRECFCGQEANVDHKDVYGMCSRYSSIYIYAIFRALTIGSTCW